MTFNHKYLSVFLLMLLPLAGCSVNPVTGKNELMLSSKEQDITFGEKNYRPAIQVQGGYLKLDKSLSAYIKRVGKKLAAVSDTPDLPFEFNIINSSVPNAWAMPGGKITINRGLLTELGSEAELAAVLAHEIVHAGARHSAKMMQQALVLQSVFVIADVASGSGGAINDLGSEINNFLSLQHSQSNEFEADKFGMTYMARAGYDPTAAIDLQATFVRLYGDKQSSWVSGLFSTHPPSQKRLEANQETAKSLPKVSYRGKSNYEKHLRTLNNSKHAYAAFDKGLEKYVKNKTDIEVLRLAQKAIKLQPKEAHFYALLGNYYFATGQYPYAIKQFSTAISMDNDYYYYYLRRGQAHKMLKNDKESKSDINRSKALLRGER